MVSIKLNGYSKQFSVCGVCEDCTYNQVQITTDDIVVTVCQKCYGSVLTDVRFEILIEPD